MFKLLVLASVLSAGLCLGLGGYSTVTDGQLQTYYDILKVLQTNGLFTLDKYTILKVETQVVAGLNIKFTLLVNNVPCEIVVFQPLLNKPRQITSNKCSPLKSRRQFLAGGYSLVNPSEVGGYELLLEKYEGSGKLGLTRSQYKVLTVQTQVVAGLNIKFTLQVGGDNGKTCVVIVFEQSWAKTEQITLNECVPEKIVRQLGGLLGGWSDVDVTNPDVHHCLAMAVDNVNQMSNGAYRLVESHVSAKMQVVAGMKYAVTFQLMQSTCWNSLKMMGKLADECAVDANSQVQSTWNAVCFKNLTGHLNFNGVTMKPKNEKPNVINLLDNDLEKTLTPINSMVNGVVQMQKLPMGLSRDQISKSRGFLEEFNEPNLTLLRKRRGVESLKQTRNNAFVKEGHNFMRGHMNDMKDMRVRMKGMGNLKDSMVHMGDIGDMMGNMKDMLGNMKDMGDMEDVMDDMKDIGNMEDVMVNMKEINPMKDMMGQDGHDFIKHGQKLIERVGHNLVDQLKKKLGGDDHDLLYHEEKLLGLDSRDLVDHGKNLIGDDAHDLVNHGKNLIGGDDHDLVNHGKNLIGGDDHDLVVHGKNLIGGDDHDLVVHGKNLIGGDDHDLVVHGKNLLGVDGHDLVNHGKNLIGGDDHDLVVHRKNLIGGDDHDLVVHGKNLIGGDDHDLVVHGNNLIGGDDHGLVNHGKKLIGGDDHDLVNHGEKMIGGDGPDYCHHGMFVEFKMKFNKMYGSDKEEEKRFSTFCDNMRTARKLQETEQGTAIYGATKFADLTKDEFRQHVGKKWDITAKWEMKQATIPGGSAPYSFDWRDLGAVTPVKNQGSCGSCWAFSTTGNIEGQWAIKMRKLVSLSEQELVDCDKVDEGCYGGLPSQAYKEIERLGGLETETDYSYKGVDEKCFFNKTDVKVYINDSVSISSNETEIASWLAANGPISIGINAFAMQFYMGGISHPWKLFCNPKDLDHGVLIVGYGVQGSKPYWIVKNSWGPDWGEKGYYLVYRGAGVCGLNTMCTSSVVL